LGRPLTDEEKEAGLTEDQARKRRLEKGAGDHIVVLPPLADDEEIVGIATGEKYKP